MRSNWRVPRPYEPDMYAWNGDLHGPSTAARLKNGTIVASFGSRMLLYNTLADAVRSLPGVPDVCMDQGLAVDLGCPLVYGERCSLDEVIWCALGTGIGSPYDTARVLRLMITARRCRVRLRTIQAGIYRKPLILPDAERDPCRDEAGGNGGAAGMGSGDRERPAAP